MKNTQNQEAKLLEEVVNKYKNDSVITLYETNDTCLLVEGNEILARLNLEDGDEEPYWVVEFARDKELSVASGLEDPWYRQPLKTAHEYLDQYIKECYFR